MVTFDHLDAGTAEQTWVSSGWRDDLPPLSIDELERLIVVAAHPDDETLGAGGLIERAAGLGRSISVVVLTNGEASHPGSVTHTPMQLAALRRAEVVAAVTELAPTATVRLLELPDGSLEQHIDDVSRAITGELAAGGPSTWVVAPWRMDGHPDHAAAGTAAASAAQNVGARLWEYPIWAWHWSTPASEIWQRASMRILELTPAEVTAKALAITRHPSQVRPLSSRSGDEAVIRPHFAEHFARPFEIFVQSTVHDESAPAVSDQSLGATFFNDFYSGTADPWGFETRWYEERKRALTLAALPRERFASALELGCSIGVLTSELAPRCDALLATDIAERPLEIARGRLAGQAHVAFERYALPAEWPMGMFDLIVLSEVGYYCSVEDLGHLLEQCRSSLEPDGVLIACHWRHPVLEYPLTGDAVHAALAGVPGLERTVRHLERDFLLEVFEFAPARSVAQREGLVS